MQVEWVSMYLVNWRSALSMLGVMDRGYAPVYSMSERLVWKPGMFMVDSSPNLLCST